MISYSADEFIAEGDQVAVFGRFAWRNRNTGKTADSPFIHRWRFHRGKVAEVYEYYDTAKALAAATPDPM
jgi:ketosteroid isomerase-like protein